MAQIKKFSYLQDARQISDYIYDQFDKEKWVVNIRERFNCIEYNVPTYKMHHRKT